jgi:hypothetical protein
MAEIILRKYYRSAGLIFILFMSLLRPMAQEVPDGGFFLAIGTSLISMQPTEDSSIRNFRMDDPGFYFKLSFEDYIKKRTFRHLDFNMSFNNGTIDGGIAKESRFCINYGIGWDFDGLKFQLSPGFCYSSIGYNNKALDKSFVDTRFAPSLGIQTDLVLIKTNYTYLALFVEGSAMFTNKSQWVQQLAIGINWQPGFRKEKKGKFVPYPSKQDEPTSNL